MSQKKRIVIPSGNKAWDYINRGYAICNKCGAVMEEGDDYTYNCLNCGWSVDQDEYVYDDGDPEPQEWTDQMKKVFGDDIPPEDCIACGGPYPHCKSSCKVFDD